MGAAHRLVVMLVAMFCVQSFTVLPGPAFQSGLSLDPEPPFVVCSNQRYALCASSDCFVYNEVAYCRCDVMKGDSISLQLDFSTPKGEKNVCDLNAAGKTHGFMVSTYSLPADIVKGGKAAVYTCPGVNNAGEGIAAPVAYGQCDGALCFTSTSSEPLSNDKPGTHKEKDILCSCPISTTTTPGSSTNLGYQVFGPYHPKAPPGKRCDANACAKCSVPDPTGNGSLIPVGAPTGSGKFLAERLYGSVPPLNECLCECDSNGTCTLRQDTTP